MATQNITGEIPVFSDDSVERLRSAGWSFQRKIDVAPYEAAFKDEGLEFPVEVRAFLKQFGGLIIPYTTRANQEDTLDFLADEAVEGLGGNVLRGYEKIVGCGGLSPIGHFACGSCLLLLANSGEVYGASDWKLIHAGTSGPDAIENIISGKNVKVIHDGPIVRDLAHFNKGPGRH